MESVLNIGIWALLIVRLDSTIVGKDLSSMEGAADIGKRNDSSSLFEEPAPSSSSSDNGGSGPTPILDSLGLDVKPEHSNGTMAVLNINQSTSDTTNTTSMEAQSVDHSNSSLNTQIIPNAQDNATNNEKEVNITVILSSPPTSEKHDETTSHISFTSSTPTQSSTQSSTHSSTHSTSSMATPSPPNTTHKPSSPHSVSSPTSSPSSHPDPPTMTPETSRPTKPATYTTSVQDSLTPGISPMEEASTQHGEPSIVVPTMPFETSKTAHSAPTAAPLSSSPAQAKTRADTPSQLSVGGDATVIHESTAVDPLLAGLVSAFIVTAVIITLLLFLKLRRRDNRPEFRRLQDLPMDDMMEDTPLSMYSY